MNEFDLSRTDVVILCGGKGERLKEAVKDRPKPMADIGGRPFLDILMKRLQGYGFRRFILCAGYKGEVVRDYYAEKPGPSEIITLLEDKLLGTAGAIKNAESVIKSDPFLVLNGDSLCAINYRDFIKFHFERRSLCSIAVVKMADNQDGGSVNLDAQRRVTGFDEKAKAVGTGYINAGVYLVDRRIFGFIKTGEKVSLEYDIFPKLIREEFYGYTVDGKLTDIGTPDRYADAQESLRNDS